MPIVGSAVTQWTVRARYITIAGATPTGSRNIYLDVNPGTAIAGPVLATGTSFSSSITVNTAVNDAALLAYPNSVNNANDLCPPVSYRLRFEGMADDTVVEVELTNTSAGGTVTTRQETLFQNGYTSAGHAAVGLLAWADGADKKIDTAAQYNALKAWPNMPQLTAAEKLSRFTFASRYFFLGDTLEEVQVGMEKLLGAGFNCLQTSNTPHARLWTLYTGLGGKKYFVAGYTPRGGHFPYSDAAITTEADIVSYWRTEAAAWSAAGYPLEDCVGAVDADEPGGYFPDLYDSLEANPTYLTLFRADLAANGVSLADTGAASWDAVLPRRPTGVSTAGQKRHFYRTCKWFPKISAEHWRNNSTAIQAAFHPRCRVLRNLNNWHGHWFNWGTFGNNPDAGDPNAGYWAPDWQDAPVTGAWQSPYTASWWSIGHPWMGSYYSAKLRAAGRRNRAPAADGCAALAVLYGHTSGRPGSSTQELLWWFVAGAKFIYPYTFGPNFSFAASGYDKDISYLGPETRDAIRKAKFAEDALYEGQPPPARVAILLPRATFAWDPVTGSGGNTGVQPATNTVFENNSMDYDEDQFALFAALKSHSSIPVDFLNEEELTAAGLASYRVVILTEPDIPASGLTALKTWAQDGGTLVYHSAAGFHDENHIASTILSDWSGIVPVFRERQFHGSIFTHGISPSGTVTQGANSATCYSGYTTFSATGGATVYATWGDGTAAILEKSIGSGRVIVWNVFLGISYWLSQSGTVGGLPQNFNAQIRTWIKRPLELAGVVSPVTVSNYQVEGELKLAGNQAVLALFNYSGASVGSVDVTVDPGFVVSTASSEAQGSLTFTRPTATQISFSIPLVSEDVILLSGPAAPGGGTSPNPVDPPPEGSGTAPSVPPGPLVRKRRARWWRERGREYGR